MAYRLNILWALALILGGCDYLDFKGMLATSTSVDDRFKASIAWNEDYGTPLLSVDKDLYSFYLLSDAHLGEDKNLSLAYEAAVKDSSMGIMLLGDLCSDNQEDYATLENLVTSYNTLPSYAIVGNHDLYFEGWKYYQAIFGTSSYYLNIETPNGNDLFIFLDTGGATLGKLQLAWLKEILNEQRERHRHCIVLTHNNLLMSRHTISTYPMNEEVKTLLDLFLHYQVDFCITGHDHHYDSFTYGSTKYIIMDALEDNNKNAAYLILTQKDGKIQLSQHPIN